MEIHGSDIHIESKIPIADNLIRLLIQDHWPQMVYEINERDDTIDLFVYKNEEAKKAWDEEGWSKENDTTMIYVILESKGTQISVTIDDHKKNRHIVEDIIQFIRSVDGNTKQD